MTQPFPAAKPVPDPVVKLLTPGEAAAVFGVDPKTVTRWVAEGRFPAVFRGRHVVVRTPGHHHRFNPAAVDALAAGTLPWNDRTAESGVAE